MFVGGIVKPARANVLFPQCAPLGDPGDTWCHDQIFKLDERCGKMRDTFWSASSGLIRRRRTSTRVWKFVNECFCLVAAGALGRKGCPRRPFAVAVDNNLEGRNIDGRFLEIWFGAAIEVARRFWITLRFNVCGDFKDIVALNLIRRQPLT